MIPLTVGQITEDLAFGPLVEIEPGDWVRGGGIDGQAIPGTTYTFHCQYDADGDVFISLQTAQFLPYTDFTLKPFNPVPPDLM